MAHDFVLHLGKVLIAAAWADGKITHEETNSLKDLLFRLPEVSGREWAELQIYLDRPVGAEERGRLIDALCAAMRSPRDMKLARDALEQLVHADGVATESEEAVLAELKTAVESADIGVFTMISRLLKGALQRRTTRASTASNREDGLEDFIKNRVFYRVRQGLQGDGEASAVSESDLRKLCLAAGLMARIAHVDHEVTAEERATLATALQGGWRVTAEQAAFVAEVAVSEVVAGLDDYRLGRQFYELTSYDERVRFLDVLFAVADADGRVSHEEMEEIRAIAESLKIGHSKFIAAKVKVPDERRAS